MFRPKWYHVVSLVAVILVVAVNGWGGYSVTWPLSTGAWTITAMLWQNMAERN